MKMSPEMQDAAAAMEPGIISREGFLGDDERPLVELIQDDEAQMSRLGLEFETVAEKLKTLVCAAAKSYGSLVQFESWELLSDESRGKIPCPWRDHRADKRVTAIKNKNNGLVIEISDLALHLFSDHHFLQGHGAPFRLEPRLIKEVLEL